ncbi:MAG: UDP-glucose/GDP-mannose dehydrogenase family protein [Gammaproteobacteria bacterium]
MRIAVFGLGYVGCVTGACFARAGHEVIGVDVNPVKVDLINRGECPIVEPGLPELVAEVTRAGNATGGLFRATTDAAAALAASEVSMVCVGTPSGESGAVNLDAVGETVKAIAAMLAEGSDYHVVVMRSTVPPGTTDGLIERHPEIAAAVRGGRLGLVMNPEFLREGCSIDDFVNPTVTVLGQYDERSGDTVAAVYAFVDAPVVRMSLRSAEMIKYANNAFHALKVTFANEIGSISKALGIDSHDVMRVVCMDDKLNISKKYLTPGFAFGGSCLPKDLRALNYISRHGDIDLPLLDSMLPSNRKLIERTVQRIRALGQRRIGMLGLSFKKDTDDLRESPFVTLAEALIGTGYDLKVFDKNVSLARLIGSNAAYIREHMPHIDAVFADRLEDVVAHAEVLVVCNYEDIYAAHLGALPAGVPVFDLARIPEEFASREGYHGLAW